jgi:hypothetical protein
VSTAATATLTHGAWGAATGRGALRAPGRLISSLIVSAAVLLAIVAAGVRHQVDARYRDAGTLPVVLERPVFAVFYDSTPTQVTVTRNWLKFTLTLPRYQFVADPTIWRQMHFEDWDRVDAEARRDGLTGLLALHGHLLGNPPRWASMTAADWDEVPQPLRAMAIVGMIEHWVDHDAPGAAYGLDEGVVVRTSKAIAMSESWFDHRAVHTNRDGSQDFGVGGASEFARDTLRRWHARGLVDFTLRDDDYFNPWLATRWLVFWVGLSIDEARGDLDLATRAYNVGIARAIAGDGQAYLEGVQRRRHRYFEGPSQSPTWAALSQYRRDLMWLPRVVVRPPAPATAVPSAAPESALPALPSVG